MLYTGGAKLPFSFPWWTDDKRTFPALQLLPALQRSSLWLHHRPSPPAMPSMPTFPTRPSLRTLLPANSHLGICHPGNRYRYSPHPHKPTHHHNYLSFLSQPNILEEELQLLASMSPSCPWTEANTSTQKTCFAVHMLDVHRADTWPPPTLSLFLWLALHFSAFPSTSLAVPFPFLYVWLGPSFKYHCLLGSSP